VAGGIGADRRSLAIHPDNLTLQDPAIVGCELDVHADREPGEVDKLPRGSHQPQALDDLSVQIEEFVFGESREIDRYRRHSMIDAFPKRQEK
jgi:hypothetical protein